MDDASRAVLALTNKLVDVGVPPLKASELWRVLDEIPDPSKLVGLTAAEVDHELSGGRDGGPRGGPIEGQRIATLLDSGVALAVRIEALRERGVWAVTTFDPAYPARLRDRLGHAAPPVLYGAGASALLTSPGIGIVGSRDAADDRIELARSVAAVAAQRGRSVMTGAEPGIEQAAIDAATEAGGGAVGVLAGPLEDAISKAATRRALMDGRLCLCTPYRPDAPFATGNARGRSKIVYALSPATLVVATDREGGETWAGATEALARSYGTVAVWRGAGEGPGDEVLEQAGAIAITDLADLADRADRAS